MFADLKKYCSVLCGIFVFGASILSAQEPGITLEEHQAIEDGLNRMCGSQTVQQCKERSDCMIFKRCDGKNVCHTRYEEQPHENCTPENSWRQTYDCCPGLQRRCGSILRDGTCGFSNVSPFSICVACGNGTCEILENRCNCAEDCEPNEKRRKITYKGAAAPPGGPQLGECYEQFASNKSDLRRCLSSAMVFAFGHRTPAEIEVSDAVDLIKSIDVELGKCFLLEDKSFRGKDDPPDICFFNLAKRINRPELCALISTYQAGTALNAENCEVQSKNKD